MLKESNIENLIGQEIPVLDHGFIRLIDYMGNDSDIATAARVSYGKGSKTVNDDINLIRYLLRHHHTTPFEMCEIKFQIKAPIFVARQWLRHRTANVNEYSARYSIMEEDYYIPHKSNINVQSTSNKQGRGQNLDDNSAEKVINSIKEISQKAFNTYNALLDEEGENGGVSREIARIVLPVNVYTQFYWKIDLHNLLHFLKLRADPHAQYEIREYALKMLNIVKIWVPATYNAFIDYVVNAKTFSAEEIRLIKELINGKNLNNIENTLSKRELAEFKKSLDLT